LAFVLSITLAKEAYDDYQRFLRDSEANSQMYSVLKRGLVKSSDLQVGDIIKLYKNARVPADCLLLRSTDKCCYIRTDQLDGETDWKMRLPLHTSQQCDHDYELSQLQAHLAYEPPHKNIYQFAGTITWLPSNHVETIDVENTLWMNTVIASQGYVLALIIYTGHHTRAVMNTSSPSTKVGLLDLEINSISMVFFFLSLITSY
jgi:phospholipid-translocating ATPase